MAKSTLTLTISVMDCEPVQELIDIICNYPKDKLPIDLKNQLQEWVDKNTSEND